MSNEVEVELSGDWEVDAQILEGIWGAEYVKELASRVVDVPREPAKAVEKLRKQFGDEFVIAMAEAVNAMSR